MLHCCIDCFSVGSYCYMGHMYSACVCAEVAAKKGEAAAAGEKTR